MRGAVLEMKKGVEKVTDVSELRLLDKDEMTALFNQYNDLLNDPEVHRDHDYEEGDMIVIDNLAVGHRASAEAHNPNVKEQGLRILHRTTIAGMIDFDPPAKFSLPAFIPIYGGQAHNPFGEGVFQMGGIGFRWDPDIHMQN